jgi:signal transduction histidine kinase/DNA-binding response OmpR family regulator
VGLLPPAVDADGGGADKPKDSLELERANILVVDDRPDKLLALSSLLEQLGQHLVTASSGRDALKRVLELDFAVILMDVNMPELNGFEAAALIRARRRSAHVPIIFMTAFADEMNSAEAYKLGAVDYILSPVVPEILRTKVKVFVDLDRLARRDQRRAEQRVALAREQAARAVAEVAGRRSAFLAHASAALADSLDLEATVHGILRIVVPAVSDRALLVLTDAPSGRHRAYLAWRSDSAAETIRVADVVLPAACPMYGTIVRVMDSRAAVTLDDDGRVWADVEAGTDAPLDAPSPASTVLLPLSARGRALGVLVVARHESDRAGALVDDDLIRELAERASLAVDNALLCYDLQAADERKNEFLAMLAHELRNPLAPIRYAAQILERNGVDQNAREWALGAIGRQTQQMARLIDDLMDVARITRGQIRLELGVVDMTAVLRNAIEAVRPLIDARRHTLELDVQAEPVWVRADTIRLMQIFGNILTNAAKYTDEGGRIGLRLSVDDADVVIRIRDTGRGIPSEMQAAIFQPFVQVERTIDRAQGGLGIGLTLVQRLVELHGGHVSVDSAGAHRGSEFTVTLPLNGAVKGDRHPNPLAGADAAPVAGLRVLVVDDNADVARGTAMILELLGYSVREAHDGATALNVADEFTPDVVLLDLGLPLMDGYEVARRLRARSVGRGLTLIAVSGYGQDDDRLRSIEAGFDHHCVKPFDPRMLAGLIRRADDDDGGGDGEDGKAGAARTAADDY